ncbi:hypothetical protein BDN71DRAFT_1459208 [Pleurotus eryngii]|uniref:Uncharacterized protein n=1 Tax=Pleurotus eryngii TaxID=5323 RepID=A0A9P5ZGD1_PLEER|nr:hypothetical protein BDN71DRAFT_1459208 [Pleurotus eryngii]
MASVPTPPPTPSLHTNYKHAPAEHPLRCLLCIFICLQCRSLTRSSTGSTQAPPQTFGPLLSTPLAATPPPSSSLPNPNTHYDDDEEELIEVGVA